MRARARRSPASFRAVTSAPFTTTRPLVGVTSRLTQRISVDLPAPDSPTTTTNSPCSKRRLTFFSATWPFGNCLTTFSKTTGAAEAAGFWRSGIRLLFGGRGRRGLRRLFLLLGVQSLQVNAHCPGGLADHLVIGVARL